MEEGQKRRQQKEEEESHRKKEEEEGEEEKLNGQGFLQILEEALNQGEWNDLRYLKPLPPRPYEKLEVDRKMREISASHHSLLSSLSCPIQNEDNSIKSVSYNSKHEDNGNNDESSPNIIVK